MPLSQYRRSVNVWKASGNGDMNRMRMWFKLLNRKDRCCPRINEVDPWSGWTALMIAAGSNRLDVVEALIAHGADVSCRNDEGETAAHLAAKSGYCKILKLLIDQNQALLRMRTTPSRPDRDEPKTALHYACESNRIHAVNLMLQMDKSRTKNLVGVLGNDFSYKDRINTIIQEQIVVMKDAEFMERGRQMKESLGF